MILGFADHGTEDIYNGEESKAARRTLPKELWGQAGELLDQLEGADKVGDMSVPRSNQLEKLSGKRRGQYSVRINRQYRVCFTFADGNAGQVEITDYH